VKETSFDFVQCAPVQRKVPSKQPPRAVRVGGRIRSGKIDQPGPITVDKNIAMVRITVSYPAFMDGIEQFPEVLKKSFADALCIAVA